VTQHSPRSLFLSGIFSTSSLSHGLDFSDANVIWVPYCTSDGWIGDVSANETSSLSYPTGNGTQAPLFPGGFRGARVVRALATSLVRKQALGETQSTRVLFGGCTPGAIANVDAFAAQLAALGVRTTFGAVSGIFDSAMLLDVQPSASAAGQQLRPSLAVMTQAAFALVGGSPLVSPACSAAYGNETWRCVFGEYALPFVLAPYLLIQPQFDRAQLLYDGGPRPGGSNASVAYALSFQAAAQAALAVLPTAAQPQCAVVSSACFQYCTSLTAAFWNSPVARSGGDSAAQPGAHGALFADAAARRADRPGAPLTLEAAVSLWFFKSARRLRVVDDCVGWRCGQCHALKAHTPTAAERAAANHSGAVGPILVGTFASLVLVGCCLACASQDKGARRSGEATPLLSTQLQAPPFQGVMPRSMVKPPPAAPL
jgi:hypothetical protein